MTRYELLERIGAGRMAEIFRAKAVAAGGFEKPVAIKRILPHLSNDPRFVELLIAEAKILSVLRHRNIVQIFDVGLGDDGAYFLVMEYVDGVDLGVLTRALERRRVRLPLELALHVGAEVCDALDAAQQTPAPDGRPLGLVHRDVSPSNVLVSRAGEVKLTDFGLARRPEDRGTAGGLRGRFGYVSPEQIAGLPVDGRSDVFALGVLVWELAVGRRLFSAMTDYEALRAITDLPVPPPSTQDRGLPTELDAIVAEALARDVDRRLPSAGELGKRLRGLRYSLESSSGDPAAALARLVAGVEREPLSLAVAASDPRAASAGFEAAEGSVVAIRSADVFAQRDEDGTGLLEARRMLEAFEDAETRMSSLPAAFDDISTDGLPLRAVDERTELTAPPTELSRDSGEVLGGELATDERELPRDTSVTPAVEPPTAPTRGGSAIETLRGGAPVVPARGGAREARKGVTSEAARGAGATERAGATMPETLRGGQAAPLPSSARGGRAPISSPPREAEPVRSSPAPSRPPPALERGRARGDWSERVRDRPLDDDWTERTPPPPPPPGAESDPAMDVPLLGSLSSLPSLGSLSAGPVNAGPALPGLPPTGGSRSPSPSPSLAGERSRADSSPALALGSSAGGESYVPAAHVRFERPAGDPGQGYPPPVPAPWPWEPAAPPSARAFMRRWWPVGLGAIAIAILSFVVTQAVIEPDVSSLPGAPIDARPPVTAIDAGTTAP